MTIKVMLISRCNWTQGDMLYWYCALLIITHIAIPCDITIRSESASTERLVPESTIVSSVIKNKNICMNQNSSKAMLIIMATHILHTYVLFVMYIFLYNLLVYKEDNVL